MINKYDFTEYDSALLPMVVLNMNGCVLYRNEIFGSLCNVKNGTKIICDESLAHLPCVCDISLGDGTLVMAFFEKMIWGERFIIGLNVDITKLSDGISDETASLASKALESFSPYIKQALSSDFFKNLIPAKEHDRIKDNVKRLKKIEMKLYCLIKTKMSENFSSDTRLIVNTGVLARDAIAKINELIKSAGYYVFTLGNAVGNMRVRDVRVFVSALFCALFCVIKCSSGGNIYVELSDEENRCMRIKISTKTECKYISQLFCGDMEYIRDCVDFLKGEFVISEEKNFEVCILMKHYVNNNAFEFENSRFYTSGKECGTDLDFEMAVKDFADLFDAYGFDFINGEKW